MVKAPKNKLNARIVSFIDITMAEDSEQTQTFKLVNHNSEVATVQQTKVINKIDVLLLGHLDNPKIKCMKQLFNKTAKSDVVSLAVKKT